MEQTEILKDEDIGIEDKDIKEIETKYIYADGKLMQTIINYKYVVKDL